MRREPYVLLAVQQHKSGLVSKHAISSRANHTSRRHPLRADTSVMFSSAVFASHVYGTFFLDFSFSNHVLLCFIPGRLTRPRAFDLAVTPTSLSCQNPKKALVTATNTCYELVNRPQTASDAYTNAHLNERKKVGVEDYTRC